MRQVNWLQFGIGASFLMFFAFAFMGIIIAFVGWGFDINIAWDYGKRSMAIGVAWLVPMAICMAVEQWRKL